MHSVMHDPLRDRPNQALGRRQEQRRDEPVTYLADGGELGRVVLFDLVDETATEGPAAPRHVQHAVVLAHGFHPAEGPFTIRIVAASAAPVTIDRFDVTPNGDPVPCSAGDRRDASTHPALRDGVARYSGGGLRSCKLEIVDRLGRRRFRASLVKVEPGAQLPSRAG